MELQATRASTHHFTEGLGFLWELAGVLLLHLPHQPLHFLPLDLLLPLLEGRLALDHLVQQAAQRPPVWAECVALVFHHLRSWRRDGRQESEPEVVHEHEILISYTTKWGVPLSDLRGKCGLLLLLSSQWSEVRGYLPMYPTVPTRPLMDCPSGTWTAKPRSDILMWPEDTHTNTCTQESMRQKKRHILYIQIKWEDIFCFSLVKKNVKYTVNIHHKAEIEHLIFTWKNIVQVHFSVLYFRSYFGCLLTLKACMECAK